MSATILPMPAAQEDTFLTPERLTAYYVAISVNPEIVHAPAVVRAGLIDRVIAGLRASQRLDDAIDARGRDQCIALMRQDEAMARERRAAGGW